MDQLNLWESLNFLYSQLMKIAGVSNCSLCNAGSYAAPSGKNWTFWATPCSLFSSIVQLRDYTYAMNEISSYYQNRECVTSHQNLECVSSFWDISILTKNSIRPSSCSLVYTIICIYAAQIFKLIKIYSNKFATFLGITSWYNNFF